MSYNKRTWANGNVNDYYGANSKDNILTLVEQNQSAN